MCLMEKIRGLDKLLPGQTSARLTVSSVSVSPQISILKDAFKQKHI